MISFKNLKELANDSILYLSYDHLIYSFHIQVSTNYSGFLYYYWNKFLKAYLYLFPLNY